MKFDEVLPMHCFALVGRLLAESTAIREELGRPEDVRVVPTIVGAEPREVYFQALVAWRKAARLAAEIGVEIPRGEPAPPPMADIRPGHVQEVLEGVYGQIRAIVRSLGITTEVEVALEPERTPSDVLVALIRLNRDLSRSLERPFTPADVYGTVALASAYALRLGGPPATAPFQRRRQPAHCYAQLEACLARAAALVTRHGRSALAATGTPPDIVSGDVYDLANLVLGQVAFLHALLPDPEPPDPEPVVGYRMPSHVFRLASALDAQLAAIADHG